MALANGENCLETLWKCIVKSHYDYLAEDEGFKMIEQLRSLEEKLELFLSHVKHDRKFYLPSTGRVLRATIARSPDCSPLRTGHAFMAIHQYANNLYTKPWRPEYKTIRTYSGYYRQEVHAALGDAAELLFAEMGYKRHADGTLRLPAPPCLDQVANVSRDALAAYVECQLMGECYAALVQEQFKPLSLAAIFAVREQVVGDAEQTVLYMFERQRDREMAAAAAAAAAAAMAGASTCGQCSGQFAPMEGLGSNVNNNGAQGYYSSAPCPQHPQKLQQQLHSSGGGNSIYANEQFGRTLDIDRPDHGAAPATPSPPPPPRVVRELAACSQQQQQQQQQLPHYAPQHCQPAHHIGSQLPAAFPPHPHPSSSAYHPSHPAHHPSAMPHSRSLDQYYECVGDQRQPMHLQHQQHQQQQQQQQKKRHSSSFDQPGYDYANGVFHTFDSVASQGFRQNTGVAAASFGHVADYNMAGNRFPVPAAVSQHFAGHPYVGQYNQQQQQQQQWTTSAVPSYMSPQSAAAAVADFPGLRNNQPLTRLPHDGAGTLPSVSSYAQTVKQSRTANTQTHPSPPQQQQQYTTTTGAAAIDHAELERLRIHAQPQQPPAVQMRGSRRAATASSAYFAAEAADHRAATNGSGTSRGISDFDSTDEQLSQQQQQLLSAGRTPPSSASNTTAAAANSAEYVSKCSEGIGSYDTWNYVYNNLKTKGYSKDLGERGNLLQLEDDGDDDRDQAAVDERLAEREREMGRNGGAGSRHPKSAARTNSRTSATGRNGGAYEQTPATGARVAAGTATMQGKARQNGRGGGNNNGNHNGNGATITAGAGRRKSRETAVTAVADEQPMANKQQQQQLLQPQTQQRRSRSPAAITEWSCTHCTLLNSMSVRVCAVCARSKDFVTPPSGSSSTPSASGKATTTCV